MIIVQLIVQSMSMPTKVQIAGLEDKAGSSQDGNSCDTETDSSVDRGADTHSSGAAAAASTRTTGVLSTGCRGRVACGSSGPRTTGGRARDRNTS